MTEDPQIDLIKFRPGAKQREFLDRVMAQLETSMADTLRVMVNHCRTCPSFLSSTFGTEIISDDEGVRP